nr:reverse transcriptase domain-containing protein [Tanacetum cinerariifolium]
SLGERPGKVWCCSGFTVAIVDVPSKGLKNLNLDDLSPPVVTMADQRTMAQFLQAPIEGYKDVIVVPAITADNFELKHGLLTLFPNVPNTSIKLMLFPFSLEGAAQIWLEKEPPRSIFTWDDLVSKFLNQFFPPSKTTSLRNEITNFQQRFDESFSEAWDRFKDLLQACPHHGFSELHQLDTFYNALNFKDQDTLNSAAGGNFLDKMPRECLTIIERKSKVRYSRDKPIVAKLSTNASTSGVSPDVAELKDMVVENEPEATKDTMNPTNNGNTKDVQPQAVQSESSVLISKPVTSLISDPEIAPVSAPKPNPKASIPYPSRRNNERKREKANNQIEKFYQIFNDMSFEISFADALILMLKFASTLKALIGNKEKLSEMARTPLNEHCSAILLKKLPKKLGDPCKFLIPCDFQDFDANLRVPLILGRSFLKTERALIDVFEELTSLTWLVKSILRKFWVFSDTISSGNPTPYYDPIVSATSPTLTLFENSDFLLEEVDAFLAIEDGPTLSEFYQSYLDPEGDILLLEAFLNNDPSLPLPNQRNYLPEVRKELKICEAKSDKSLVDEPPVVELKVLPPHLEYAFLEGDDKLPIIIAKYLSVEEKTALITVLKSHNPWVSSVHCVPKKSGFTVVKNEDNELIPTRLVTGTFQRCMMAIFHDMIQKTMEVFMDDFSVFGNSFPSCLFHLERMLKRCEDTNLCLNWEKSQFMVKEDHQNNTSKWINWPDFSIGKAQVMSKAAPRGINQATILSINGKDKSGKKILDLGL